MSLPTTISDLNQTGRVDAPDPTQARTSVSKNLDFSSVANVQLDFSITNQQQVFGVPRSLYIDNGTNPNPVYVTVSITNQQLTVAPLQVGYFPLNATDKSTINFQTDGGATRPTPISVYNYEQPASNWYSNGTGSTVTSNAVQGSMNEGADVSLETNNDPVYIGGIDRGTGLFHAISVDATGVIQTNVTIPASQGAFTDRSIASLSGASQQLMAANANRRYVLIQNISVNPIGINLVGGAASIGTAGTITIIAGGSLEINNYVPTGQINVIGTATNSITAYEG